MKCSKCGHELDKESVFCPNCGGYIFTSGKKSLQFNTPRNPDYYKHKEKDTTSQKRTANREILDEVSVTASRVYEQEEIEEVKGGKVIKNFFIGLFVTVLLLGAASFAGYYAYNYFMGDSTSEYTNSVSKLSGEINKANNDMALIIKKDANTLPVSDILKGAYAEYDLFNKISSAYDKIIAPSTYSDSHQKLGEAIKLNKSIYQQLDIVLRNPIHPDTKKNMDLLSNYIDSCMNNYSQVKVKNVSISLPNEILSITSKLQPWIKQKQTEYGQIATLITAFAKYFDDMAKLFVTYDSAAADFNQTLRSVRSDQEKWEKLFSQIDNSEKIVKSVKTDYEKLSIPAELRTINKRFGPILDEQLSYYAKLRLAAQTEKDSKAAAPVTAGTTTSGSTTTPPANSTQPGTNTQAGTSPKTSVFVPKEATKKEPDVNTLFQEADKIGATASENYQKFALDLKSEKDKYLDPEFVLKLKSGK